ncbi:PrpF domain-containing protein [Actinomycetes bacterium M1A6_2h]
MRGGTSKCWLFNAVDVDPLIEMAGGLDAILSSAFGSGDPRQLDGVGGGSSTTSKAAIVRRSSEVGVDIEYLFAQVAIGAETVEWGSNCGNCATAIGLYAVQTGLVPAGESSTTVRMRNTNTGALLVAEIATAGGVVPAEGSAAVPGTTALGVPVALTFVDVAGAVGLLPTGRAVDTFDHDGRSVRATLVSAGAPSAFFDADDLGLVGSESISQLADHVPTLIALRRQAAIRMGLCGENDPVSNAIPKVGIVGAPVDYRTTDGTEVAAGDYDVSVRMLSMMAPHPAIGLTSAVAIAAAATVSGSGVAARARVGWPGSLRVGTAAGVIHLDTTCSDTGNVSSVTLHRAARRIAQADLFVTTPARALAGAAS